MSKNFQEPEEHDQDNTVNQDTNGKENGAKHKGTQAQDNYKDPDMLTEEEVIERSHAKETKSGPRVQEWTPPPYDPKEFEQDEDDDDDDPADNPLANPGLKNQPEDEKLQAGKKAAKGMFEGIDMILREAGNQFLLFKRRKLERLEREGEINLDLRLYYRNGESETAGEAIERYNDKARDIIALPEDYKEKGAEIFGPELAKRGIGLTDKQYFLTVETGKVLKKLGKRFAGMYAVKNDILEALREQTANPNTSYTPPPRTGAYQQQQEPGPAPEDPAPGSHDDQPADQQDQQQQQYQQEEVNDHTGKVVFMEQEEVVVQNEMMNGNSVEDIQNNRGAGVIVEEQLPREFQPQQNNSSRRRSNRRRKKKS